MRRRPAIAGAVMVLAATFAVGLGVGLGLLDDGDRRPAVSYPLSAEASSEFEPGLARERARVPVARERARLPKVVIVPEADVPPPPYLPPPDQSWAADAGARDGAVAAFPSHGRDGTRPPAADKGPRAAATPQRVTRGERGGTQLAALPVPVRPPLPAWRRNAVRVSVDPGRPMVAIVIDDLGIDRPRTARALALKGPLTVAFLPYAHRLPELAAEARAHGHELLVHVPMEPQDNANDPGPDALLTGLSSVEIEARLIQALGRFEGYVGINNHMGSRFTRDPGAVAPVMAALRRRGLLFLDSRTVTGSVASRAARAVGVPTAARDVFLDRDLSPEGLAASLDKMEALARRAGYVIAIGHPHDVTLDALEDWLADARARGFQMVPVSTVVARFGRR